MPAKYDLVIVESPTKAKTIARFLNKGYKVMSSYGHVRDLPKKELGVSIEKNFAPRYVVPLKAKKVVSDLKRAAASARSVYFASDEDREGEAIAWHLRKLLDLPEGGYKRISFHEITEEAIKKALTEPRDIDLQLVDAQQARRILDRLVGYELSPFLWRKVTRGISAGRVQSVAVRLIVEREREIKAFKPQEYWTIEAALKKAGERSEPVIAKLLKRNGESLDKFALSDAAAAENVLADLDGAAWSVAEVEKKQATRSPLPPFITSTLQQEANNRLGFSAKQTMMLAQQLYEGVELGAEGATGLITYMRTDSVNLAEKFIGEARDFLSGEFGAGAVPTEPRRYRTRSKTAQEAHEAVRPTDPRRQPQDVAQYLDDKQRRLYELIWRRALASQMSDAELAVTSVDADAAGRRDHYIFRANGTEIAKRGFLEIYDAEIKETELPKLSPNDQLTAETVAPKQHFTEPLPRYSEATLVKALEENGIGRPSTYAPTITTIVERGYVNKESRRLEPTELAFLVTDLLVNHFPDIVDYGFTARMEEDLDAVAEGKKGWVPIIAGFYGPFKETLRIKDSELSKKDIAEEATEFKCEKCGKAMIIKFGRFGRFLACSGFPACRNSKPIPGTPQAEMANQIIDEKCPTCGSGMVVRRGRFGEFISCVKYPECKTARPLLKKIGVKCPACKEGDIVEKRARGGKTFYACSRYPDCKQAMWTRPTGEDCPNCGAMLVFGRSGTVKCSNKECGFEKQAER